MDGPSTRSEEPTPTLIIAEAERIGPVINLAIPKFRVTEITDQARFSNERSAVNPLFRMEHGLRTGTRNGWTTVP